MKNKKRPVLSWIFALVCALLLWTLGFLCAGKIPNAQMLSFIPIFFIPVIYCVNLFGSKRYIKKLGELSTADKVALFTDRQQAAKEDLTAVMEKRHRSCRRVIVYLLFLGLLCDLMCFFCGAAAKEHNAIVQLLLAMYIYQDIISRFFCMDDVSELQGVIPEEKYPLLWKMARETAALCGYTGELQLIATPGSSAGVGMIGKTVYLSLGVVTLDLLTEEELRQTMIHEFGHVADKDYIHYRVECEALRRFLQAESTGFNAVGAVFLLLPTYKLELENYIVNSVSTVWQEKVADAAILSYGKPEHFVSGLAKLVTCDYFDDYSSALPCFYEPEKPRANISRIYSEGYKREFRRNREQWLFMLTHELPARLGSHPSFPERRAAVGNCDFTVEFPEEDSPFRDECHRLMDYVDSLLAEAVTPEQYAEARRENYLRPLAVAEKYEAGDTEYTTDELSPVLNAYRDLGRHDKLEALCDKIIAEEENPYKSAHAVYCKGWLLLNRYDKSGIELLYRAAELNNNYMENGMDSIGKFCLRMGLEQELQEYRDKTDSYIRDGADEYVEAGRLTAKDRLVPEKFPDDRLPEMLDFMVKAGDGLLEEIYLVRKLIGEDFFTSVFVIRFAENVDYEKSNLAYERIFNYLDQYPDGWQFSLFVYDKEIAAIMKKHPDAKVYTK